MYLTLRGDIFHPTLFAVLMVVAVTHQAVTAGRHKMIVDFFDALLVGFLRLHQNFDHGRQFVEQNVHFFYHFGSDRSIKRIGNTKRHIRIELFVLLDNPQGVFGYSNRTANDVLIGRATAFVHGNSFKSI